MTEFSLAKLGHRESHSEETMMHRLPTKSPERLNRFNLSVSIIYTSALIGEGNVFKEMQESEAVKSDGRCCRRLLPRLSLYRLVVLGGDSS